MAGNGWQNGLLVAEMFTGIIETMGTLTGVRPAAAGRRMQIRADRDLPSTKIGDSIAVSGACLTVVEISGASFSVDVSPETLARSTLGRVKAGDRVNLERAMRLSDRLDGHLVSGHIDGRGEIHYIRGHGGIRVIGITVEPALSRYLIRNGSVAVDGISLTVNACEKECFEVTVIPHTAAITTIGDRKPGEKVNIETDMIGKYVERFVRSPAEGKDGERQKPDIDMEFLAKTGFL